LKDEGKELQALSAALAKQQAVLDVFRSESHADYEQAEADLEVGLSGVQKALGVFRDYYGSGAAAARLQQPEKPELHAKACGAGGSIIDILEVVELGLLPASPRWRCRRKISKRSAIRRRRRTRSQRP